MKLSDFQYDLPEELIARYPLSKRSASRLLILKKETGEIHHQLFSDLSNYLKPGDLLVCNNTKVMAARLRGHKATGGQVELLVERVLDEHRILTHLRCSKKPVVGSDIIINSEVKFKMLKRHDDLFELRCYAKEPVLNILEKLGEVPLPPYFSRLPEAADKERYQTVFAKHHGSVAAPTAGLHFDIELLETLKQQGIEIGYVTLHIGAGTFAPVRTENILEHKMHSEYVEVSEEVCEKIRVTKKKGGRVIAVGTTAARCLETATLAANANEEILKPFAGETDIFIYPGFVFHCIDGLITNFHLPCSTLLMLVSALGGLEHIKNAYTEAIKEKYRFYSYGDAMLIY